MVRKVEDAIGQNVRLGVISDQDVDEIRRNLHLDVANLLMSLQIKEARLDEGEKGCVCCPVVIHEGEGNVDGDIAVDQQSQNDKVGDERPDSDPVREEIGGHGDQ